MAYRAIFILFLLAGCASARAQNQAVPSVPAGTDNHTHTANFGDLSVTTTNIFVEDADNAQETRKVMSFATLKNTGQGAVCASFIALLKTSSGSEYLGDSTFSLHIYDMLPGQNIDGQYLFNVKAGEQPLELIFELQGGTIRCSASRHSARKDASIPKEIRLDVHDLPGLTPRAARPDEPTFHPGTGGVSNPRCLYCLIPSTRRRHAPRILKGLWTWKL